MDFTVNGVDTKVLKRVIFIDIRDEKESTGNIKPWKVMNATEDDRKADTLKRIKKVLGRNEHLK